MPRQLLSGSTLKYNISATLVLVWISGMLSPAIAADYMAFILLSRKGDTVQVSEATIVPGLARLPRFPVDENIGRKWRCQIEDENGRVVWTKVLRDPFDRPRHLASDGNGESELPEDSTDIVLRLPYESHYAKAACYSYEQKARVPIQKSVGQSLLFKLDLRMLSGHRK